MNSKLLMTAPSAARQVRFHQLLVGARKSWLMEGLSAAVSGVDPNVLKTQLMQYVPPDVQQILAATGIRDEWVFPTPIILEALPTLIGYYRLLLGAPQKTFYKTEYGFGGRFRRLEGGSPLTKHDPERFPDFCRAMAVGLADLVRQLSPEITRRDVAELPLLTLGSQLQGSNNNVIGKRATLNAFQSITEVVKDSIVDRDERSLTIRNASGRTVVITLAADPDVQIREEVVAGKLHNKVAIEIKGGSDQSNAHNRAGEAEKSHIKAKRRGYRDFWTVVAMKGVDTKKLKRGSPTTRSWFDVSQVLGRSGPDWEDFKSRIAAAVGIPRVS